MTYDAASRYTCVRCQTPVHPDDVVFCSVCGKPHHLACWNAAGACSAPDCPGMQAVKPAPTAFTTAEPAPAAPVPAEPPPYTSPPEPSMPIYQTGNIPPPPPQVMAPMEGAWSQSAWFRPELTLSATFSNAWQAFSKAAGIAIVVFVIYHIISFAAALKPVTSFILIGLINPAFTGGIAILSLNMINDANPGIADLFAGFRRYFSWLGLGWLSAMIITGCIFPALIAFVIVIITNGMGGSRSFPPIGMFVPTFMILAFCLVLLFYVGVRWLFCTAFLVAEGNHVIDALSRNSALTAGVRWRVFWILAVIGLMVTVLMLPSLYLTYDHSSTVHTLQVAHSATALTERFLYGLVLSVFGAFNACFYASVYTALKLRSTTAPLDVEQNITVS